MRQYSISKQLDNGILVYRFIVYATDRVAIERQYDNRPYGSYDNCSSKVDARVLYKSLVTRGYRKVEL
jgi:hypothetical protein